MAAHPHSVVWGETVHRDRGRSKRVEREGESPGGHVEASLQKVQGPYARR